MSFLSFSSTLEFLNFAVNQTLYLSISGAGQLLIFFNGFFYLSVHLKQTLIFVTGVSLSVMRDEV